MSELLSRNEVSSGPSVGTCGQRSSDPVADQIERWKLETDRPKVVKYLERILHGMETWTISILSDPRLQVAAIPRSMIWAYFPVHKRRWIVRQLPYSIDSRVRVLLVVGEDSVMDQPKRRTMAELAHHFGHALCYLRDPRRIHTCADANRTARKGGFSQFLRTPREIYGPRKRDFYCDLSESALRRKLQRLEELNRA